MALLVASQTPPRKRSFWIIPKNERMIYEVEFAVGAVRGLGREPLFRGLGSIRGLWVESEILAWSLERDHLDLIIELIA